MFERCPKCGHAPLPLDQALPAECPACGVILAKVVNVVKAPASAMPVVEAGAPEDEGARGAWLYVPPQVDTTAWKTRVALLVVFAVWGLRLAWMDYREGEIAGSFLHGPLLVFHEAGHVVFRPFGQWIMVLGGTLGQLIMPAVLCGALLKKNRDPFGAAIGLWLFGVSILDIAPYMYDALHPQLMLLSGTTGDESFHDWIYLFDSVHQLAHAQGIGAFTHALGTLVVLGALGWAAVVLRLQHRNLVSQVLLER